MRESRLCLIAGVGAATLYLATASRWYSADSLWFALALDSPDPNERIDPYHLLLHPLSWLWVALWRAFGWTGFSIHALQALNALAGAACVALVCSIAARASGSLASAALVAAGCAVSGGLWLLSTEAEDVTLGMAAHLGAASWILGLRPGGDARPGSSWALGAAIGAATLTYASCALLLGVAVLAHWQGRNTRPTWLRSLAWMGAGFVCLAAPIAFTVFDFRAAWADQAQTLARYIGGEQYGRISPGALPRGFYAFLRMLALHPGLGINDQTTHFLATAPTTARLTFAALYTVVAAVAVVPLVYLWKRRRDEPQLLQRLLLWGALFAIFALWWVPSDLEFWLPVALVWWIALALVIRRSGARQAWVAVLAVSLLLVNGFGLILPHRDAARNQPLQIALRLGREVNEADRVIALAGVHVFMRYFTGRDSIRVDTREQLDSTVAAVRAKGAPPNARLFIAGIELSEAERSRWRAGPLFEDLGRLVWELR